MLNSIKIPIYGEKLDSSYYFQIYLFIKIYVHKSTHSITVINGILDSFIRQIEPNLHKIHAKHDGVFL